MSELYIDGFESGEDIEGGGGKYLGKDDLGWFHFLIEDVDDPESEREHVDGDDGNEGYYKAEFIKLTLTVLAPEKHKDKIMDLKLHRTGGYAKRTGKFARTMGLLTKEMVDKAKEEGRDSISIAWRSLQGQSFCAERELDTYEKKGSDGKKEEKSYGTIKWNFCSMEEGIDAGYPVDKDFVDPFGMPATPPNATAAAATDEDAF